MKLYKNIFGENIPDNIADKFKEARETRNKVIHGKIFVIGKNSVEPRIRKAIHEVFEYCKLMNENIKSNHHLLPPFGPLRGFNGGGKGPRLDENGTKLLLKRMGFKEQGSKSGDTIPIS